MVLLHDLEGWRHSEIAVHLELSEGMSRRHLSDARQKLRELRAVLTPEQRARLDSQRRAPMFMIKRKMPGSATTVDTVFPGRRDSARRP